jgi:hypothetical protein
VPIDPYECKKFNPMTVPTLTDLIGQMDSGSTDTPLMKPYIDLFKVFLKSLSESIRENLRAKRQQEEKKLNF